jgi:hypothetical protein
MESGVVGALLIVASAIFVVAGAVWNQHDQGRTGVLVIAVVVGISGLIMLLNQIVFSRPRRP